MQYIRLLTFRSAFPEFDFPVKPARIDAFRTLLYERIPDSVFENERRIQLLTNDASLLFMGWIDQEEQLAAALTAGIVSKRFENRSKLTEHALFNGFKEFVTPYLFPVLEKEAETKDHNKQTIVLSYCNLLTEMKAEQVQSVIYSILKAEQEEMERNIARAVSEEGLMKAVQPYLRPSFIELLNSFGSAFYRARTNWMEALFSVSSHPGSSKRLVLHIARQLATLKLSEEHSREIRQLNKDVKTGVVQVERTYIPWKRVLMLSVGCFLIAGICWYIWKIPARPDKIEELENNTSFMSFSVEERKAMDSLLQRVTYNQSRQEELIDEMPLPYVGIDLQLKDPWKNKTAAKLLDSWQLMDTTISYPDPKNSTKDDRSFPATAALEKKSGTIKAVLSNPTTLSVFVMIFEDKTGAPVYSGYISKKTAKSFRLKPGEIVFALPGSKVPKELKRSSLPFEEVDSRFFAHMHNQYIVSSASPAEIKLVWTEVNGSDYYLLDLNGALTR